MEYWIVEKGEIMDVGYAISPSLSSAKARIKWEFQRLHPEKTFDIIPITNNGENYENLWSI